MDDELGIFDDDVTPSFRASIRDGRLTLLPWFNQVVLGGPTRRLARAADAAGVSIADIAVIGTDPPREVSVVFEADGDRRGAERALARWAGAVGYRRIWFPDRVVELDGLPALGRARTSCNACGVGWAEDDADFWQLVAACGYFPVTCPLCGGDLPQWTVDSRRRSGRSGAAAGRRSRSVSPALDTRERS